MTHDYESSNRFQRAPSYYHSSWGATTSSLCNGLSMHTIIALLLVMLIINDPNIAISSSDNGMIHMDDEADDGSTMKTFSLSSIGPWGRSSKDANGHGHGHGCAFPAIFNFGDSSSDTGGVRAAFPFIAHSEQFPYGETFFHKPANRFSDGRLLIDFIAQGLGKSFLSPFLQSVGSNFSDGANFASSGATAMPGSFISPMSLAIQVNQFKVFKQQVLQVASRKESGEVDRTNYLPEERAFAEGLYIIGIGGNDFSYAYMKLKMNPEQIKSYLPKIVNAVSDAITALYDEGARRIWVLDLGPQGCMPMTLTKYAPNIKMGDIDECGCARNYNEAVALYNRLLREQLRRLQSVLPTSDIVFVDTFHIQYSMIKHAPRYGFNYTTRACCGVGGKHNFDFGVQCGMSNHVHGQFLSALSCVNPSEYINWDGVHLTDHANEVLARQILSGSYFRPFFPLIELCPPLL